ncbi:hypothetical protein JTE90_023432 [Oedothorax gibbosus]|uniref:Uncharacterized protein n=1 Tax=Oedothorax gibbosus TaxID=931172 RepID=A0AAV6U134_9ARAC|nr:hypothetical protein JTE90_023432 [Oedothorax gibbosus]
MIDQKQKKFYSHSIYTSSDDSNISSSSDIDDGLIPSNGHDKASISLSVSVGDWVEVDYEGDLFKGEIKSIENEE